MLGAPLPTLPAVLQNSQVDTLLLAQQTAAPGGAADASVVSTFTERLQQSFAMLGEFVPALFGALAILFGGYVLAKGIEMGATSIATRALQ